MLSGRTGREKDLHDLDIEVTFPAPEPGLASYPQNPVPLSSCFLPFWGAFVSLTLE